MLSKDLESHTKTSLIIEKTTVYGFSILKNKNSTLRTINPGLSISDPNYMLIECTHYRNNLSLAF